MQDFIGKEIDRYRIIERLGMGGMAVVYRAYDARLEREVALKLIRVEEIPPSQLTRLMARFEREAKTQARFNHPNIVPAYDYGDYDGTPYLVLACVSGGTLKDRFCGAMGVLEALEIITPIADAVAYAHQMGVLHRDIKPSNILFSADGTPMLTDFGIAKLLETTEATLTGTGLGVGTPEYMAPEQWQGKATQASDQYALGVVLYELLTGQKPYTAETPLAVALKQLHEPLQRPSALNPEIPEELEKILYKALAREPKDRYVDMAAFGKVLEQMHTEMQPAEIQPTETQPAETQPAEIQPASLPEQPKPEPQPEPPIVTAAAPVSTGGPTDRNDERVTLDAFETDLSIGRKAKLPKAKTNDKRQTGWILWVLGGVLLIGLIIGATLLMDNRSKEPAVLAGLKPEITSTSVSVPTQTSTTFPTKAMTATQTEMPTPTPTPTPRYLINYVNDDYEIMQLDVASGKTAKIMDIDYDLSQSNPITGINEDGQGSWWTSWSDNGRYLVCSPHSAMTVRREYFYGEGLFLYDLRTAQVKTIVDTDADYRIYGFSPDNRYLLFASLFEGVNAFYIYNIETEMTQKIDLWSGTIWSNNPIEWDREEPVFYFMLQNSNVLQKYTMDTNTLEDVVITDGAWRLRLNPLGDKLYIEGEKMSIVDLETRENIEILSKEPDFDHRSWGWVDNSEIIGAWVDQEDFGIFRINADNYSISYETVPQESFWYFPNSIINLIPISTENKFIFIDLGFLDTSKTCVIIINPDSLVVEHQICTSENGGRNRLFLPSQDEHYFMYSDRSALKQIDLQTYEETTIINVEGSLLTFSEYWE